MDENQLQPFAQPSFVDDEFVIAVFVKAGVAASITTDEPHARCWVLGVFNECFVGGTKLRVNEGSFTLKNQVSLAPVGFGDDKVVSALPFHRRHQPLTAFAQVHFAQRSAVPTGDGSFLQRL